MYTTKKKIGKLTNQVILAWLLIGIALINLAFKDYNSFENFQAIGNFLDSFLMAGLGIIFLVTSNKYITKIKGLEFSIDENQFVYKHFEKEEKFNSNLPAQWIKKTLNTIEIETLDKRTITINLKDYMLNFQELKSIENFISVLNKKFEKTTTTNKK